MTETDDETGEKMAAHRPAPGHWSPRGITCAAAAGGLLIAVVPLGAASVLGVPLSGAVAVILTTLFIEYGAGPVGLLLGLSPWYLLLAESSVALGAVLVLYSLLDASLVASCRWQAWILGLSRRFSESRILSVYGIFALVPGIIVAGFYACTPVAWLLAWDRRVAIILMAAGYTTAAVLALAGTMGALSFL